MPLQRPAAVFSKAQNENDGWATLGAAHIDSRSTMLFGTVISEMLAILHCLSS